MYFLKNKLESVKQYAFLSTHFYYINEQEMLFCDGKFLFNAYGLETGLNSIFCYSNLEQVQTTLISIKGIQKRVNESLMANCYNGQDTLSFRDYKSDDYTHQIGLYHVNNASMNWFPHRYSIGLNIRKNNEIYHLSFPNRIGCLSLTTVAYKWQVVLEIERIIKIVAIFADKLIVTYETAQNQTGAAALDAHTGAILWQQMIQGLDTFYAACTSKGTLISLKSGGLWHKGVQKVKGNNLFVEIDLQTGDVLREGFLQALEEADLQVRTFEVKAPYIYFTANHQGSFGAIAIGVLSVQTLKLLWWEVVKMEQAAGFGNFLLNSITVSGNQLGILDKTGVLHLYEKQAGFRPKGTFHKGLISFDELKKEATQIKSPIATTTSNEINLAIANPTAAPTPMSDDLPF